MGDEVDNESWTLQVSSASDIIQLEKDLAILYFVVKKNVIYERAKFTKRAQQSAETVDSFITATYTLAENCENAPPPLPRPTRICPYCLSNYAPKS